MPHNAAMRPLHRILAVVALLAALALLLHQPGWREHFDLAVLRATLARHLLDGGLLFVLLFCLGNLAQVPGLVFLAAAVLVLGRAGGGLLTYVAANLSCLCTFCVVRAVGGDALRQLDNRLARRILARLHQQPVRSVVLLRMLFQTAPALNLSLALSGISLRQEVLGTLIGLPVPIALYCIFFDYLAALMHIQ